MDKDSLKFIKTMIAILFLSGLLIGLIIGLNKEEDCNYNWSDNFISSVSSPILIKEQVLASMSNDIDIILLAEKIIQCESGWDYTAQNPNSTAYGAGQFLNGTWNYVQKKWGIELDRYNKEDQLYAMVRLLEEEGTKHWITSKNCLNK